MSITHIPFYPSDWLAGTRGMTAEETGVYITLIARMYEMAGPIERDDERLYRICGCKSKRSFQKVASYLIAEGKVEEVEGQLFNERVQKEIKKVVEKSSKAKDAAEARWKKKSNKNNNRDAADAMQTDMLDECYPKPKPYRDTSNEVSVISLAIDKYNYVAEGVGWPRCQKANASRTSKLKKRLKECGGIDGWQAALTKASESDFLCNRTSAGFTASIDFLLQESSFTKLMEGNYDNRTNGQARPTNADTTTRAIATAARARRTPGENLF